MRQRLRGSSVRMIALFHGVTASLVTRLTTPFGPFPSPSDVQRMIEQRRAGLSLAAIASEVGLSSKRVGQLTQAHGPFGRPGPDAGTVAEWVRQRQARVRLADIAGSAGVSVGVVEVATNSHGPYPSPRHGPPGLWSSREIATVYGVAAQSVAQWREGKHGFPAPVPHSGPKRPKWKPDDVQTWAQANLTACPDCSAKVLSLAKHRRAVHR